MIMYDTIKGRIITDENLLNNLSNVEEKINYKSGEVFLKVKI